MADKLLFSLIPDELLFDLWIDGRWVGMSKGKTVVEARALVNRSYTDKTIAGRVLMTPFYGCGTSDETYKAITGRKSAHG